MLRGSRWTRPIRTINSFLINRNTKQDYTPEFRVKEEHLNLIANNPVAGARFFNVMVNLFLKHVLGVGLDRRGLYGDTAGYYGTVEQQGRLTLHLHMLL